MSHSFPLGGAVKISIRQILNAIRIYIDREESRGITEGRSGDNSSKSWLAALLLCIFLGVLGGHRFYVGRIITGIIYIALTVTATIISASSFDSLFWYLAIAVFLWWFVDLVFILTGNFKDKTGYRIKMKAVKGLPRVSPTADADSIDDIEEDDNEEDKSVHKDEIITKLIHLYAPKINKQGSKWKLHFVDTGTADLKFVNKKIAGHCSTRSDGIIPTQKDVIAIIDTAMMNPSKGITFTTDAIYSSGFSPHWIRYAEINKMSYRKEEDEVTIYFDERLSGDRPPMAYSKDGIDSAALKEFLEKVKKVLAKHSRGRRHRIWH